MVSSLRDYLKKMDRDWDKKGKPHFADVLAAHDVQAELNQCVHSYLDKNFKHWMQGKAEDDVREALRDFQKDLKQYIVRIEGNLQRNRQTFSGIKSVKIPVEKHLPGVAAIDAANIADEILIKNGWNDVLQQVSSSMQTRSEMQEWSESLRVQVASRIPFLNRVIDRELQEWKENVKRGNEAFLKQLRETLYRELEHQLPQIEHEIGKEVKKRLKKVVSKIADRLSKQIEELIRQQAHIIEDMKQEGFSLQETLRRLESIEQLLLDALNKAETMLSEPQEQ